LVRPVHFQEEDFMSIKHLTAAAAAFALAAPALAAAADSTPSAESICRAERTQMGEAIFKATYGTNANKANAFGKCVSKKAPVAKSATQNASKACDAEEALDPAAFQNKYGTGKNKKNAHGKCVSSKAKDKTDAVVKTDVNAAKKCKAERALDPAAFKAKYGTNKNKSNAFGKCVSKTAKA